MFQWGILPEFLNGGSVEGGEGGGGEALGVEDYYKCSLLDDGYN